MIINPYIVGGAVSILLLLIVGIIIYLRRKHRIRPINIPTKHNQESIRQKLLVDIDSSTLTNPQERGMGDPYYLVIDTETYEAISFLDECSVLYKLSKPVALSWQILDSNGLLLKESTYILHQKEDLPMQENAITIHGITNDELERGVEPYIAYRHLAQELECVQSLVAHNLRFHVDTLVADLQRNNLLQLGDMLRSFPHQFCTMEWGKQLGFKHLKGGEVLYPSLDELFGYLYFRRMHLPIGYKNKTIRDIRLVSACLRVFIQGK